MKCMCNAIYPDDEQACPRCGRVNESIFLDQTGTEVNLEWNACPECYSTLNNQEGCVHCKVCGWSACA